MPSSRGSSNTTTSEWPPTPWDTGSFWMFEDSTQLSHFTINSNGVTPRLDLDQLPESLTSTTPQPEHGRSTVSIIFAGGHGYSDAPLKLTHADFRKWFEATRFSPRVLAACSKPLANFIEHNVEETEDDTYVVDVAFGWLNSAEMNIGVTDSKAFLQFILNRCDAPQEGLEHLNGQLVTLQREIGMTRRSLQAVKEFARDVGTINDLASKPDCRTKRAISRPTQEQLIGVSRRADMGVAFLDHCQKRIDSLFSVLYNRMIIRETRVAFEVSKAAKKDSSAMKTIAFLTLIYLPSTFDSSTFSTTIFDFQNWGEKSVASPGWWTYFISCVALTFVTIVTWFAWSRHEDKKWNRYIQTKSSRLAPPEDRLAEDNGSNGSSDLLKRQKTFQVLDSARVEEAYELSESMANESLSFRWRGARQPKDGIEEV
ncbi:hypothetical protein BDY21DRAFT_373276 [Lineolata rhizophorae]|uniref:Uncharacterized protein n=1 Tax=Lineolata rhizophorae TaxID=578093 RepID=A0A6A6NW24_9PEZI|nr:hypothetical protein BDY21DRAFT_373276 [Lineolata rhizophorae]